MPTNTTTEERVCFKAFVGLHDNVTQMVYIGIILTVKGNDKPIIRCI